MGDAGRVLAKSRDKAKKRDVLGDFEGDGGRLELGLASSGSSGEESSFELGEPNEGTRGVGRGSPPRAEVDLELRLMASQCGIEGAEVGGR